MIVVSNASPLISLGSVGRIELLHQLFGEISIPRAVLDEVKSVKVPTEGWVVPRNVENAPLFRELEGVLDPGEAEAIALAVELRADLLLMDERRGRRIAEKHGLQMIGTLGLLIEAKGLGLIENVEQVIRELHRTAGFRVSQALFQRVLEEAGEA